MGRKILTVWMTVMVFGVMANVTLKMLTLPLFLAAKPLGLAEWPEAARWITHGVLLAIAAVPATWASIRVWRWGWGRPAAPASDAS